MISCIIFSKNRAMQLESVLRSLKLHCQDVDQLDISVLYQVTGKRHFSQYQTLAAEYAGQVTFKSQENFRRDLFSLIHPYLPGGPDEQSFLRLINFGGLGFSQGLPLDRIWRRTLWQFQRFIIDRLIPDIPTNQCILFLVDDNIFVRSFTVVDAVNVLRENMNILGFSLRLGENISYSYSENRVQVIPNLTPLSDGVATFDWTTSDGDFGYPLEVSSSVYRLRDILPLLASLKFENPNALEDRMAFHSNVFQHRNPFLACFRKSVTFCNPINKVQRVMPNRSGNNDQYLADELAVRFDRGERIGVELFSGFVPTACHQEVELVFKSKDD